MSRAAGPAARLTPQASTPVRPPLQDSVTAPILFYACTYHVSCSTHALIMYLVLRMHLSCTTLVLRMHSLIMHDQASVQPAGHGERAQSTQICAPNSATPGSRDPRHIGSARGYQGVGGPLSSPGTAY